MEKNTLKAITIIAIVIGAFGLTFGYLVTTKSEPINPILILSAISAPEGDQGAAGDPVVGILDPDHGEMYSGNVTIRAMVWAASAYTVSVLRNGTEIGTTVPLEWNTTTFTNGWYNITIVATDASSKIGKDEVWILINNTPQSGVIKTWYTYYNEGFTSSSTSFVNITGMNNTIFIEGKNNVSLYLSFSCPGYVDAITRFRFTLDGINQDPPIHQISPGGTPHWMTVFFQQLIYNVTPGQHLIQVQTYKYGASGSIQLGYTGAGLTLLIQSLIP